MRDLPVIDDPWVGKVLDERFDVLGLLGKGGMGAIYRCRERDSGAELALKIVLDAHASDPEVRARFDREIQASCGIQHVNVVQVYGHGSTRDGRLYFVMELLRGQLLEDIIVDDAPLSTTRVAHIGAQIARGLHAAHSQGIIHRDLKPENVVVGDDGLVKVFDFGLSLDQRPSSRPDRRLTAMHHRLGTPMYMAPEYIEDGRCDARTDLYALGVVLYEAATGYPPFRGTAYQILQKQATEQPIPIRQRSPGLHPDWLSDAIEALLQKDPADRPPTAARAAELLIRPPDVALEAATVAPGTLNPPSAAQPSDPSLEDLDG